MARSIASRSSRQLKYLEPISKEVFSAAEFISWLISNNQAHLILNILRFHSGIEIRFPLLARLHIGTTNNKVYYLFVGSFATSIYDINEIKRWFTSNAIRLEKEILCSKDK